MYVTAEREISDAIPGSGKKCSGVLSYKESIQINKIGLSVYNIKIATFY